MAWTNTDDYNVLPNLYLRKHYDDNGNLRIQQLYPCSGYVLHISTSDGFQYDEEDNLVLDENGNPIVIRPYYTWGGAMVSLDYDFSTNPENYHADVYDESMIVIGDVKPPHEVM